jgi:hypothetical protein
MQTPGHIVLKVPLEYSVLASTLPAEEPCTMESGVCMIGTEVTMVISSNIRAVVAKVFSFIGFTIFHIVCAGASGT